MAGAAGAVPALIGHEATVGVVAVAERDVLVGQHLLDEDLDQLAVELAARDAAQLLDRLRRADRRAVGVAAGHHVVGVGDRDHARQARDRLAREAAGVAPAVDPLVVGVDDLGDGLLALEEPGDGAEQRVGLERLGEHLPRHVRVGKARDEQDGGRAVQARQVCRQGRPGQPRHAHVGDHYPDARTPRLDHV